MKKEGGGIRGRSRTLLDEKLLVISDRDVLLGEVPDRLVGDFPEFFSHLTDETWGMEA